MFGRLSQIIGKSASRRMALLLVVMFFGSLLEMFGISLIVSVCSAIVNIGSLMNNRYVAWFCAFAHIHTERGFIIALCIALVGLYLFKMLYLLWENILLTKFVKRCRHDVSMRIFYNMLHWPYEHLVQYSSSQLTNILYADMNSFASYLLNYLYLITEVLVVACLGTFLFSVNLEMTAFCCAAMVPLILVTRVFIKRKMIRAGELKREANRAQLKWAKQVTLGAKDIRISQTEDFFYERYERASRNFAAAEQTHTLWSRSAALCSEMIMIVAVLLFILKMTLQGSDLISFVPDLSALTLAVIRLMPAYNRISNSIANISYAMPSLSHVINSLRQPSEAPQREDDARELPAEERACPEIRVQGVTFRYASALNPVLRDASLEVPAGASVGIVGSSGAGKTTLVDLLLGLLQPQRGRVLVDGEDLRSRYSQYLRQVSYIPQNTFLLDDTIRSNVAFGISPDEIDDEAVWRALADAALADMVRAQPDGLDTRIGEGGIRLSGGERQRLGIARALYRGGSLLVFDEATSALDQATEAAILDSIHSLKGQKTMIVISHRGSAVADCDRIYRVKGGSVTLERAQAGSHPT